MAHDAWTALDGIVYNITPYLRFHPGGAKEMLRTAGRDGTKLFSTFQLQCISRIGQQAADWFSAYAFLGQLSIHAERVCHRSSGERVNDSHHTALGLNHIITSVFSPSAQVVCILIRG